MRLTHSLILEQQMKAWTSDVYSHFVMPPKIEEENGEVWYKFECLRYVAYPLESCLSSYST